MDIYDHISRYMIKDHSNTVSLKVGANIGDGTYFFVAKITTVSIVDLRVKLLVEAGS